MYQSLQEQKGKVDEELKRTQSSLRMAKDKLTEGERSHSSEMDSARREFNSQLEDSRQKMDSARRESNSLLEDSRQKHEQARMHMEAEHQRRVERLLDEAEQNEHNHQQETARLNKIIHGRTKAIVTRETFTPITDRDLKTKFTELYSKVDSLGRLQWSPGRSTWRDDQLRQVRINSKKLQKSIIQETVWLVLHEYILCSPFRVFGKEGKIMEKQWNDAYGNEGFKQNHFCWPAASFESEKWRYETIRPGQDALQVQTSEYDPRTKLRKAYQENVQLVQKSLAEELARVADLDEKAMQTIKTIATNVSEAWVLFGTQRCRLFFLFEKLKVTVEPRESDASSGQPPVELLVKPELRRLGNADGESLDKEKSVSGCDGEIRMFEY